MLQRPASGAATLAAILALGLATGCSERGDQTTTAPPAAEISSLPPTSAPPPGAGPASPSAAEASVPTGEGSAVIDHSPLGVFEGTLPCADCDGIRTELTLFLQPDTYLLRETYLGGSNAGKTVTSEGSWQAALGLEGEPDATVIQLDPGKPESMRSFREAGGDRLELLDPSGRRVASKSGTMLTRRTEEKEGS